MDHRGLFPVHSSKEFTDEKLGVLSWWVHNFHTHWLQKTPTYQALQFRMQMEAENRAKALNRQQNRKPFKSKIFNLEVQKPESDKRLVIYQAVSASSPSLLSSHHDSEKCLNHPSASDGVEHTGFLDLSNFTPTITIERGSVLERQFSSQKVPTTVSKNNKSVVTPLNLKNSAIITQEKTQQDMMKIDRCVKSSCKAATSRQEKIKRLTRLEDNMTIGERVKERQRLKLLPVVSSNNNCQTKRKIKLGKGKERTDVDTNGLSVKKRKTASPKVSNNEMWNIVKVLLDLLGKMSVNEVLECVTRHDWNTNINQALIQEEPGSYAERTGTCLKQFFKKKIKGNYVQLLEMLQPTLKDKYPDGKIKLLEKLFELYNNKRRYKEPLSTTGESYVKTTPIKTAPVQFCFREKMNMVRGVMTLLKTEKHSNDDIWKCLKSNWRLEINGVSLLEFIRQLHGSYKDRLAKSYSSQWSSMVGQPENFYQIFENVIQDFPKNVQDKLKNLLEEVKPTK